MTLHSCASAQRVQRALLWQVPVLAVDWSVEQEQCTFSSTKYTNGDLSTQKEVSFMKLLYA
jgi:hypothetical protein